MRTVLAILSLLALCPGSASAQRAGWTIDAAATVLPEAWDYNESREWLAGGVAGIDRNVAGPFAARVEAMLLRVAQEGGDAWLRGFTTGTRIRWLRGRSSPFADVAVGLSHSTVAVPPRGTRLNYLAMIGGGIEVPVDGIKISLGARWLHVSNNGREGRGRNPDIQSIGAVVGVGWNHVF